MARKAREIRCQCLDDCGRRLEIPDDMEHPLNSYPPGAVVIIDGCEARMDINFILWDRCDGYEVYGPRMVETYCQCNNPDCELELDIPYIERVRAYQEGLLVIIDGCSGPWSEITPVRKGRGYKTFLLDQAKELGG